MVRELKFLTVVEHTAYFFCKDLNYLLPIPVSKNTLETIIKGYSKNTRIRVTLEKIGHVCKVKTELENILALVTEADAKIEIEEKILVKKGIFVTKSLIREALETT